MEQVATWNGSLVLPERGITLPTAVDANLRDRVRSIFVSRNQQNPPKTPCPSPDLDFIPHLSQENIWAPSSIQTRESTLIPTLAAGKLLRYENRGSNMGNTKFDGPAGHIQEDSIDTGLRRFSQSSIHAERKSSSDWPQPSETSRLNQRSQGNILDVEASVSREKPYVKPSVSKRSTGSKIPRFHLRTIPPAVDVNKANRPNALHIPGSYRSEVDVKKDQSSKAATAAKDDILDMTKEDGETLSSIRHPGPEYARLNKAIDALHQVAEHDHIHHEPLGPTFSDPPIKEHVDNVANGQSDNARNALWRPLQSYAAAEQVAQSAGSPVALSQGPAPETQPFVVGSDDDEKFDGPTTSIIQPTGSLDNNSISDAIDHQSAAMTAEDIEGNVVATPFQSGAQHLMKSPKHSVFTVYAAPSSLLNTLDNPKKVEREIVDDVSAPPMASARGSSQNGARNSPISRALSMLSEISARTIGSNQSTRSSMRYEKVPSLSNLTSRSNYRLIHNQTDGKRAPRVSTPAKGTYQSLADRPGEHRRGSLHTDEGATASPPRKTRKESITRVITDLESLLKEALNIAGQASSKDESTTALIPAKANHTGPHAMSHGKSFESSLFEGDEEDNDTTLPKYAQKHGEDRLTFIDPEYEALYHGHFKKTRNLTPYPAQTGKLSTVSTSDKQAFRSSYKVPCGVPAEVPLISVEDLKVESEAPRCQAFNSADWATQQPKLRLELNSMPMPPQEAGSTLAPAKEQRSFLVREHGDSEDAQTRNHIRDYVHANQRPPVQPRMSSVRLRPAVKQSSRSKHKEQKRGKTDDEESDSDCDCVPYVADFQTSGIHYHPVYQGTTTGGPSQPPRQGPFPFPREDTMSSQRHNESRQDASHDHEAPPETNTYSLQGRHHFSIREPRGFSLSKSHRRSPIARDWSSSRKRFTAAVACITTAFIGLIIGIYAGEVPAIQYAIADEHHYTILGNVLFFIGLAITTALFYPLPLLHGRKTYTLAALAILLPLQFPQALATNGHRTPYVATYRIGLLLPRFFAGIVMGFANINLKTTLLDLFGSSLQSGNPHQEIVNENDVRRHGGGMGVWLGIWTWCSIGSIGLGFLIGAGIISGLNVSWGFWILIILNAIVLVLNILTPEVRRSAFRRSMTEVRDGSEVSRRVARGEIKMHLESTGPIWWGQEVFAGHVLAIRMLKQPGFAILSLYLGWVYGQVVIVVVVSRLIQRPKFRC